MNIFDKENTTELRIMEVLKIFHNGYADKREIISLLKENYELGKANSLEVYHKYFNTFEALGLKITQIKGKYSIEKGLIVTDLTIDEEKLLYELIKTIPQLNNDQSEQIAENLFLRIEKYVTTELKWAIAQEQKLKEKLKKEATLNTLKNIMNEKEEVSITFKNSNKEIETIEGGIKKIQNSRGHYYVTCYNNEISRNRKMNLNAIIEIKRSPKKSVTFDDDNTVIYEVYGRLAKSYKLKEWEILEDFGEAYARISNTQEDIDTLLTRLLKYGENCKIIYPQKVAAAFLSLTDDILKNLEK